MSTSSTIERGAGKRFGSETGSAKIRIVQTVPEIEELRPIWTSWHKHPNADIDFFLLNLLVCPVTVRPHIMVLYRDGRPDCLLVGRLEHRRMSISVSGRRIFLPRARVFYFIRGGFLGSRSRENSEALAREVVNALRRGEADAAEFSHLPIGSPLYNAARGVPGLLCRDHFPFLKIHRSMTLTGSFRDFFKGLPRRDRHNLKNHENMLLRRFGGHVRMHCFRTEEEVETLIRDAEEVAKKTYQRAFGGGFAGTTERMGKMQMEARKGMLRGYVLYIDERPAAFLLTHAYEGTLYGRFMGYDPQYGRYSPGSYLLMRCVQDAFAEGLTEIDFGPGDQRYKRAISNHEWNDSIVEIFAPSWKGLELNCLRTFLVALAHGTRKTLERAGLLENARKLWRRRVIQRARKSGGAEYSYDFEPGSRTFWE